MKKYLVILVSIAILNIVIFIIWKLLWLFVAVLIIMILLAIFSSKIHIVLKLKHNKYVFFVCKFFFVLFLAIAFRLLGFEIYSVASNSMNNTLLPGDIILTSRLSYGPVLPRSLEDIPWLNRLVGYNHSYINSKYRRLKGLAKIKVNDIIVFKNPFNMEIQVKRCLGVSGDVIYLMGNKVKILNKEFVPSSLLLFNDNKFNDSIQYSDNFFKIIQEIDCFCRCDTITDYTNNLSIVIPEDSASLTETNKYFFMVGDNRPVSIDSRYWGFLHEKNVIGKATYVLINFNNGKFTVNRFLKKIE